MYDSRTLKCKVLYLDSTLLLEGFVTDITEHKELQLSLQASEAKFERILNNTIAAITSFTVFDTYDWEYEYWSVGCEALFGYSRAELMADKKLWLSRVFLDDCQTIVMPLFEVFFAEKSTVVQYRFYHKDGSLRWISSHYTSQRHDEHSWLVTAIHQELSDRQPIAHITEKHDPEVLSYQRQGRERVDSRVSEIVHDLNNAFTPILAVSKLLRLQHPNLKASSLEMLQLIENSAKQGASLVQEILAFTRETQAQVDLPPIAAGLSPSPNPRLSPPPAQGQGVLIVDDDSDVQMTTQALLEHYQYSVLVADNAWDAIALYTQQQLLVGLIILDIKMPDMDGITLIKKLKAINTNAEIIAISGLAANREPALAAGAKVFLTKPYTLDQLLEVVQSLLPV
ncbi:response regulator [Trichothermofontia sp.]